MLSRHAPIADHENAYPIKTVHRGQSSGQRLMHIDTVRGLLLVFMAINHIPSYLHAVTDHPFGFMSAAEGFVFMAGLMAGYIYTRSWLRGTFAQLKTTCARRAASIYRLHVAIYVLVLAGLVATGYLTGAVPLNAPAPLLDQPALTVVTGLLLVQQPTLFDILPMYCVLLLVTPWCLRLYSRAGYGGLLAGSFTLWAASNIFCQQDPYIVGVINTGAFNLASWQLLYVAGLAFGHRWAQRQHVEKIASPETFLIERPRGPLLACLISIAAFLFCARHGFLPSGLSAETLSTLTNKNNLAPLRLLDTALILYLGYFVVSRFPRTFSWRPFAWIGRASLTVFSTHVLTTYAINAWPEFFDATTSGRWLATALMLVTICAAAACHEHLLTKHRGTARAHVPKASPPLLQTRQPRTRRLIVRHEPRPPVPADSFHRRSR